MKVLTYKRSICKFFIFIMDGRNQDTCLNVQGGVVAQSVERSTPGEEVPGSIPVVTARSLLVGSVSV